ncbi:outer membrane protein assembly factor BamB family protein [Nannocystis punicea]|uniref:PQQ-binding-like beta-propeller repeat protein n=1 Tax=Nannocystis punicea TaxID=2995304 RepID=A0ABY7H8B5_9BACT|nr:PQQ-binding-like beta-propeller repeat protein [Nannocystis poenicansa]WAS95335.1 PQQ-binding-like beta-propeller repeat protein [Nannocystis poenicansa]
MTIWGAATCLLAGCGPRTPGETGSDSSQPTGSASDATDTKPGTGTPASEPGPTDPTPPPTTTATSGTDTDDASEDTSVTEIPPEPVIPLDQFTCAGARWRFVEPSPSLASNAHVDSRGHLRLTSGWDVLDFDPTGDLAGLIAPPSPWGWGGIDAADDLYVTFRDERAARKGLRKFAATGEVVWEIDRGPSPTKEFSGRVTVGPDGTTLVGTHSESRLERYDPAGALLWDKTIADKRFTDVVALNSAGVAAALRHGRDGAVIALAPDASVLWEQPFSTHPSGYADIDENGEVVATSRHGQPHVARLAADGSVLWDKLVELPQLTDPSVTALATNEAGATALSLHATLNGEMVALALRLDKNGEVAALHACDPTSQGRAIAIDEAGVVYLAGVVWAEDGEHLFAVALE